MNKIADKDTTGKFYLYASFFIHPYAQIWPRGGKRGKDKRHTMHGGQRQRQNQEAEEKANRTGREARGKPPGPARTYKKNFSVPRGPVVESRSRVKVDRGESRLGGRSGPLCGGTTGLQ